LRKAVNLKLIVQTYLKHSLVCLSLLLCATAYTQEVQIRNGVNIQASYYNGGYVNMGWDLMQNYPEIEAVRIEIEPDKLYRAQTWISEAHEQGYQVIATYHNARKLGSDNEAELNKAANWWKDNYALLSSSGPIIINIMNEWGSHDISPLEYAAAYNSAIAKIKTVYSGPLIVDVPGFGQATKIAADAYPLFDDQDIIYSVHIYTNAFNIEENRWLTHDDLAYLDATGADCMVGEFCDDSTGGADWCTIIDNCYVSGWPLFGWAWNGDGKNMNMVEPHWRDEPLANTFYPTEVMKVITDKLAGIQCYTQADEACDTENIGQACNDGNDYTVNDRYNEYCHCTGTFATALQSNSSDADLVFYPNPLSTNQILTIELFKIPVSGEILIFNNLGESIMSIPVVANQERILIETDQFPQGLYYANFQNDQKIFVSRAFMIY